MWQGYGEVRSRVEDVEVWGLCGADAKEHLAAYQKREVLFSEQRGKVSVGLLDNGGRKVSLETKQLKKLVCRPLFSSTNMEAPNILWHV